MEGEYFEEEVLRYLRTPPLEWPHKVEPRISVSQLKLFEDEKIREILLTMSVLEENLRCITRRQISINNHVRRIEAETIRLKLKFDKSTAAGRFQQFQVNWYMLTAKWIAVVVGAGMASALIKKLVDLAWPV